MILIKFNQEDDAKGSFFLSRTGPIRFYVYPKIPIFVMKNNLRFLTKVIFLTTLSQS